MPINKLLGMHLTGICVTMDDILNLENEDIVVEIKQLVKDIDTAKDEINIYCDLLKQIFLSGSNKN